MERCPASLVSISEIEGKPVLLLEDAVDLFLIDSLHQAALRLVERGEDTTVCCEKVEHMDVSALQVLLALKEGLRERGKTLRIVNPSSQLQRLLALTGLTDSFSTPHS